MDKHIANARRTLLVLFAMIFVTDLSITLLTLDVSGAVRIVLTLVLMYCTFRGYAWARRLYSILCIIGGVLSVLIAFGTTDGALFDCAVFLFFGLLLWFTAFFMLFSPSLARYFQYQNEQVY